MVFFERLAFGSGHINKVCMHRCWDISYKFIVLSETGKPHAGIVRNLDLLELGAKRFLKLKTGCTSRRGRTKVNTRCGHSLVTRGVN